MTEKLLNETLTSFTRIRATVRLNRRDVLLALDQAEACIMELLCDTAEAEGFNDVLADQADRAAAANKKLAQLAACFAAPGTFGTA